MLGVNIDEVWDEWFIESCAIAEGVGSSMKTPRTTNVQRNRANVPADTPRGGTPPHTLINRGNFLALLEHKAARDPVLDEHLRRGKKNQKYISKTIQNDIILTAAECLKEELLHPLKKTTFYSIIADEVTDPHANQEVLSVCVRFLDLSTADHPQIKEVFIDFIHLRRATGEKVGKAIMSVLRRNGLDVKNIRGQAYDGASAMSSSNVGTQAQIKAQNPLALLYPLQITCLESGRSWLLQSSGTAQCDWDH
nr:52 kDa repressor of the inhibitor of the protein kinase-like [Lytechinus pictus]